MSQARPGEELIHKIISHFHHGAALYRYLSFILKHRPPPLVCRAFWWTSGACPAFLQRIRLNVRYRARSIFHKTRSALAKTAPPPTEFSRNVREIRPVAAPVFLYYEREQRCTRQDAVFFLSARRSPHMSSDPITRRVTILLALFGVRSESSSTEYLAVFRKIRTI